MLLTVLMPIIVLDWLSENQRIFGFVRNVLSGIEQRVRRQQAEEASPSPEAELVLQRLDAFASREVVFIAWGAALLTSVLAIVVWFFIWQGGGGPNPRTAERVTTAFVEAVQSGNRQAAQEMLVEEMRLQASPDDLVRWLEMDGSLPVIAEFEELEVCEFAIVSEKEGRLLASLGLLHYEGGVVVFGSWLRRGADFDWRVYDFRLLPELDTDPWGRCFFRQR